MLKARALPPLEGNNTLTHIAVLGFNGGIVLQKRKINIDHVNVRLKPIKSQVYLLLNTYPLHIIYKGSCIATVFAKQKIWK